tara:strand:- start:1614 stop:1802 length:189 start_codon:yes stop_codon:yes gene_type:complete
MCSSLGSYFLDFAIPLKAQEMRYGLSPVVKLSILFVVPVIDIVLLHLIANDKIVSIGYRSVT